MSALLSFAMIAAALSPGNLAFGQARREIPIGVEAEGMAVDVASNRIFVPGRTFPTNDRLLAVVDGARQTITTVPLPFDFVSSAPGNGRRKVGLNPATNRLYMPAQFAAPGLAAIETTSFAVTEVPIGLIAQVVAVNPVTNRIYAFGDSFSSPPSLAVVNGNDHTFITIPYDLDVTAGMAVDTAADQIYMGGVRGATGERLLVTVDGPTNAITSRLLGIHPLAMDVNTVTRRLYIQGLVLITNERVLLVIDLATGAETTIPLPVDDPWMAVNTAIDRVYLAGKRTTTNERILVHLDGGDLSHAVVETRVDPLGVDVNPDTGRVYIPGFTFPDNRRVLVVLPARLLGPRH